MSGLFDFIVSHPYIIILLIFWIVSQLVGKKKVAEKKQAAEARRAQIVQERATRPPIGTTAPAASSSNERLATAELSLKRVMEQADREFFTATPAADTPSGIPVATAATSKSNTVLEALGPGAKDDPFAFHSLLHKDDDADAKRTDYDIKGIDYDIKGIDYDTQSQGFGFREAIKETTEQAFHLSGFQGFQSAQGLSQSDRRDVMSDAAHAVKNEGMYLAMGPDDIRRAIVMREILDRPKALRR